MNYLTIKEKQRQLKQTGTVLIMQGKTVQVAITNWYRLDHARQDRASGNTPSSVLITHGKIVPVIVYILS